MKKAMIIFLGAIISLAAHAQEKPPGFEVIAYYAGNGDNIEQYDIGKLTQIIFSFLHLKDDTLHFPSPAREEALRKVAALKQKFPALKVLVSLGGWGGCATCSDVFANEEGRKNFAASVARIMKTYEVDGIDLDWEYPTIPGYPGHKYQPADKDNFTDLIIRIREAIGPKGELSFAAGGFTRFLEESVDWDAIMPHLNRVNLMTYDLVHGASKTTGHHTALMSRAEQQESTDHCVQWLLNKKVPAEKLVIGAAFYARVFENVSRTNWGLFQSATFKRSINYKDFALLEPDLGWAHQWDDSALAPFAFHKTENLFATYDNNMSLYEKVKYARRYGLGGIMFWELTCDAPRNGLLQALHEAVEKTRP
ncbi:MAG TPA: glycosyl hydrolase family 18 protein [Phnomibacter sp.]|nr:glycosyl hydrolase family 18 protein [Phnomibacter sp.]